MFTNTQPTAKASVLRQQKDGTRMSVACPESVILYNQSMGGVDRGDQLLGYHCRRVKEIYKYVFFFTLDVAIINAYILQKCFCPSVPHKTIKDFQLHLAKQLIGNYCSSQRLERKPLAIRSLPLAALQ